MARQGQIPATLIPGDGIGPEIVAAVIEVLSALGSPFAWEVHQGGLAGIKESGDPLPQATLYEHPPDATGAEGHPGDPGGRRLPLVQREAARGVPPLRQRAAGAHPCPGGSIRGHIKALHG